MYDSTKVLIGLGLFAVVFGYPFYNNLFGTYQEPALAKAKQDVCVEDPDWMRANHMDLLNEWRHAVSREGLRVYTSKTTGKQYIASLQRTCMDCHGSYDKFCNECHVANSVNTYCWTCHITPEDAGGGMPGASTVQPMAEPKADYAAKGGKKGKAAYLGFKEPHAERMTAPTHDGTMRGGEAAHEDNDHGKEHSHE